MNLNQINKPFITKEQLNAFLYNILKRKKHREIQLIFSAHVEWTKLNLNTSFLSIRYEVYVKIPFKNE